MTPLWKKLLSENTFDPEDGKQGLNDIPELARKHCEFTEAELREIQACRDTILSSPELLKNWTIVRQIFRRTPHDSILNESFPAELHGDLPQETFLLLIAIACIPDGEKFFREKNLPLEKLYESFISFKIWTANCKRNFGVLGLEFNSGFAWIVMRLLTGVVLHFGRLECNQSLFFSDLLVFRRRISGEICVLLNGNYPVTETGLIAIPPEKVSFHTGHAYGAFGPLTGYPVTRDGRVQNSRVELDPEEWELILGPCDPVLYLHIPESGPLLEEQVLQSLKSMDRFYREHTSFRPKAIVSGSWLFDPILQELLPETSNLCRFQKMGYLLPSRGYKSDAVRRVFGKQAERNGIETVEWKTSLQKKLGTWLKNGGICRGGRFLYMP